MSKISLLVLALFILSFTQAKMFSWQTGRSMNNVLGPRGFHALDFSTSASEIRSFVGLFLLLKL
jgi:hypothetical protein